MSAHPAPARLRRFRIEGATTPAGVAIARALGADGWEAAEGEAPALLVEARPLPVLPALLDPPSTVALAEAMAPLVDLGRDLGAAELAPGGLVLLVSTWAPGTPPAGWTAMLLALRRAWVEEAAREAPFRVGGIAAPVGARLPGFLRREAAGPQGVAPDELARAALWLAGAPSVTGRTLELGPPSLTT
jgi:hypothetical protein